MGLKELSKEELQELVVDAAKRWLAHDGVWFQSIEAKYGMEMAIEMDRAAWEKFTVIEAKRIMDRLGLAPGGGLPALKQALQRRLYAYVNRQEIIEVDERHLIFRMNDCRVQSARQRKGMPDFPCKTVGQVEYSGFAATIDPRIKTRCLTCPPDEHPAEYFCAWEFYLEE